MRPAALVVACAVFAGAGFLACAQSTSYPIWETDKIGVKEYQARRAAVLAKMPADSVAVMFTNPERNRNNDCDFRFRGDSSFLYLTGCEEPDSALILAPGGVRIDGQKVNEVLFVNDRDPLAETWNGYRMGPQAARDLLGFQAAVSNKRFPEVLQSLSPASLTVTGIPQGATGTLAVMLDRYGQWRKGKEASTQLMSILGPMRTIKSADELRLVRHAVDASVKGHLAAISSCRPSMREYELQAIVEFNFTKNGCEFQAYNSIVGSGPNSCILHYEEDRRKMNSGDIVCMDVAGEYHGYAADITRSFPVSGHYSKEQRAIYDLVLKAQTAGIDACKVGAPFNAAHGAATAVLEEGMIQLGIIKNRSELFRYFMHGTSHTVGLDVHDWPIGTLQPNVVMTVEPGIYIKEGSPCDPKWWNIGIRIEDDILITPGGPEILSRGVPRKAEDIERLMAKGRS